MQLLNRWLACALCFAFAGACVAQNRSGPFHNNYSNQGPQGLLDLLHWQWAAAWQSLPPAPRSATPSVPANMKFLHANNGSAQRPSVTWIGHATVLIQMGGLNILTDPVFSQRVSPISWIGPKRMQPPGIELAELPHIDVVVISHNHYDHLDLASVQALSRQAGGSPQFLVPLGLKAWFTTQNILSAIELDWWQSHSIGPLEVVFTPTQHWSGRGIADRKQSLWGGFALFAPNAQVFFAGDTAYSKDFADIRSHFAPRQTQGGFDVALIPIGAYEPVWFMGDQHVTPAQAVQIHFDLGAKRSMGIHWGTFELSDEALDEPPQALARARLAQNLDDSAFFVIALGETRQILQEVTSQGAQTPD